MHQANQHPCRRLPALRLPYAGNAVAQIRSTTLQLRNCMDCGGSGKQKEDCPCCGGTGSEVCSICTGDGRVYNGFEQITCYSCSGRPRYSCDCCAGSGYDLIKCITCGGAGQLSAEQFDSIQRKRADMEAKRKVEEAAQAKLRAEAEANRKAEEHAKWLAEAPKRKAEEEKRAAEEKARQETERVRQAQAAEQARKQLEQARFRLGCCEYCGRALGSITLYMGRRRHDNCTFLPLQSHEGSTMVFCQKCSCAVAFKESRSSSGTIIRRNCVKCGQSPG